MSNKKIDDALGIDIDKLIQDAEDEIDGTAEDAKEVERYNKRKEIVDELKQNLKDARTLSNSDWSKSLLKNSAEKIAVVQEIFSQEIEEDPASKNVTAFGELSNALVNTVNGVLDVDREQEKINISKEKNDLRRAELNRGDGPMIDAEGKSNVIGVGSNDDIMKMLKNDVIDVNTEEADE